MAKTVPNGARVNDAQSLAFEVRLPTDLDEESLANFEDALQGFVERFGYELHTPIPIPPPRIPTPPAKVKAKSPVKTSLPTSPR